MGTPGARLARTGADSEAIQRRVTAWYETHAHDWQDIYRRTSVSSRIRQRRQALALAWIDGLRLPTAARTLDLGSGAGLEARALAERGLAVTAVDPAWAMLRLGRGQVAPAGQPPRILRGDGHALGFRDGSFDLVVALGVVPWLHTPARAVSEIVRVLAPGGCVILTAHNRLGLTDLLDPVLNPLLKTPRRATSRLLGASKSPGRQEDVRPSTFTPMAFDRLLQISGLVKERGLTFGFGPFSVLRRHVLPVPAAAALDRRLQAAADRGAPVLRHMGIEYMALARKPGKDLTCVI